MTETADRYRRVAAGFTARVEGVSADGWDAPAPCEGWVARDIVEHVRETSASFLARAGVEAAPGHSAQEDPVAAWTAARDSILAALDDPAVAGIEYDTPMGRSTLEQTVGMFGVGDVLIHTWDLARATGGDEALDPDEVHRILVVMEQNDAMMRGGTAFGPRVEVPDDADEQTRLIAFTGRTP